MNQLDAFTATILGLVEGITEFLPVSSTGHLVVTSFLLGLHDEKTKTFEIFIQAGAILAVVVLYWRRFLHLFDFKAGLVPQKIDQPGFSGSTGLIKLALCCAPIFVLGALFGSKVKHALFYPTPIAAAFIIGGILMWIIESRRNTPSTLKLEDLSVRQCLLVGIFQCAALWPGVSRSAATILGGLLIGIERRAAAELSFLAAVPVLCAAVAFDLLKNMSLLSGQDIPLFAIGFVVSFVTAIVAVKFFIGLLSRYTLKPFAVYRVLLGIFILLLLRGQAI